MKFPLPLQLPTGARPTITQKYGATYETLEPEGPNGEPHFHYGLDIVCGDDHATYGTQLRCPFPTGTENARLFGDVPEGQTPFIQIEYTASDGTKYEMVCAHISELDPAKPLVYNDPFAKVGNAGLVYPKPDLKDPYQGAHLHLGLKVNGVWTDPAEHFDLFQWFYGPGPTRQDQLPATNWLISELLSIVKGITGK